MESHSKYLRTGTCLYAGASQIRLGITQDSRFIGSGDYEDPSDLRDDRKNTTYTIHYEAAGNPGVFKNMIPNFATLRDAIAYAESNFDGISWDDL